MKTKFQIEIKYKKHKQLLFCLVDSLILNDDHWVSLIEGYKTQVDFQEYNPFENINTCYLVSYSPPTYDDYVVLIETMVYSGWIAK